MGVVLHCTDNFNRLLSRSIKKGVHGQTPFTPETKKKRQLVLKTVYFYPKKYILKSKNIYLSHFYVNQVFSKDAII